MNVRNAAEFEFAGFLKELIELGCSTSDLQFFFPEYFGSNEKSASAKALRTYKALKPKKLKMPPGRRTYPYKVLEDKSKWRYVSDFAKLAKASLHQASNDSDLIKEFVKCYKVWLDTFNSLEHGASLNFQQAFSIFKHVFNSSCNESALVFYHCESCTNHYPKFSIKNRRTGELTKEISCPYCA